MNMNNLNKSKKSFKFFIIFPTIAFGLGTWQVYRYFWKKEIMQNAKDRMELEPVTLSKDFIQSYINGGDDEKSKYEFRRVTITGKLMDDRYVLLGPRGVDGLIGYYIISPMVLEDGNKLLVNRGWSAATSKSNYKIPSALEDIAQLHLNDTDNSSTTTANSNYRNHTILGVISKIKERGSAFTPTNQPDKGQWYSLDVNEMAKVLNSSNIMINTLDEFVTQPSQLSSKSINNNNIQNSTSEPQFKRFDNNVENSFYNKHMSYIVTWYGLSASLFFIYFKFMKK